jgi:TetR/AcrR family transcriptional repressor of nem operon
MARRNGPLAALCNHYLSLLQRDEAGRGCAFAALGADAARQAKPVRAAFTSGLQSLIDILMPLMPGQSKMARRRKAFAAMAQLVGAMVLARAVNNVALSGEILMAAKADLAAV